MLPAARSHSAFLQAILAVLGDEVADTALQGVDLALARLEARIAGKTIPDRYRRALAQVHNLSERGHLALEAGNECVVMNSELPGCMLSLLADIGMAGDDQADPSG